MFQYSLDDLLEFLRESNAIENVFDDEALNKARRTWTLAKDLDKLKVSIICKLHFHLMNGLHPTAGQLRTVNVRVGDFLAPDHKKVYELLRRWVRFLDYDLSYIDIDKVEIKEEIIKSNHIKFEKIHPFEDGNGRIGRILMNVQRVRNDMPLKIIHTGEEQQEYYKWFA